MMTVKQINTPQKIPNVMMMEKQEFMNLKQGDTLRCPIYPEGQEYVAKSQ